MTAMKASGKRSRRRRKKCATVVRQANIKGRGGAGFPAGIKWGFIPQNDEPKYVVINADESETGTFKDRELLERNPHQVIEGALICRLCRRRRDDLLSTSAASIWSAAYPSSRR